MNPISQQQHMKELYRKYNFVTIAPSVTAFVSGGNTFNKELFASLQQCKNVKLSAYNPSVLYDDNEIVLVDSLCLHMNKEWMKFQKRICILHYHPYLHEQTNDVQQQLLLTINDFHLLIVTSNFVKEQLTTIGVSEEMIVVMEPVVYQCGNMIKRLSKTFTACSIANYVSVKGIADYLQKLDSIRLPIDFTHHFIGDSTIDPPYYDRCKNLVASSAYLQKTVQLHPAATADTICSYFNLSHVFISTSNFETFGMAVKEALHAGLPVLALSKGNLPNLIMNHEHLFENIDELISYLPVYFEKKTFTSELINKNGLMQSWNQYARLLLSLC